MKNIKIKPLSVNKAWQGKRFKTIDYTRFERYLMYLLPKKVKIPEKIELRIKWGLSSKLADIDNPLKPFIDVLQKKYKFNDNQIFRLIVEKEETKKGDEFIAFEIVEF